eukprot:4411586-Alexandrium_andersonii.AAC.1
MSASLVGSEMCIRDRILRWQIAVQTISWARVRGRAPDIPFTDPLFEPVSYTHLTLPTICSV